MQVIFSISPLRFVRISYSKIIKIYNCVRYIFSTRLKTFGSSWIKGVFVWTILAVHVYVK